jgi:hypothetical protein
MSHPYRELPAFAYWRRAVASLPIEDVDPVVSVPFVVSPRDTIATAGSCFAQHIPRFLARASLHHLMTEDAHPLAAPERAREHCYGVFSARYGNVYTPRQLLQLVDRASGTFRPKEDVWLGEDGRRIDPFRPRIQPGGFLSRAEYDADRRRHFACVGRMLRELDVLVFTLGLTEAWISREDGAVFPLCPGVAGGVFDPDRHAFVNFDVAELASDLLAFVDALRTINPASRVILTVSPVPLVATAEPRHVLVSTMLSKARLRVACEELVRARSGVAYFPAYEIVAGSYARGRYFAADGRSVTAAGLEHVMGVFLRHFAPGASTGAPERRPDEARQAHEEHMDWSRTVADAICDEVALDQG